jgi:hypothetical protein
MGISTLYVNHFKQKMVTYNKYDNVKWFFLDGKFLAIVKSSKKLLE